jgi:hypothetical protein
MCVFGGGGELVLYGVGSRLRDLIMFDIKRREGGRGRLTAPR